MDLILFRHADAGDAEEFAKTGKPDDLRPLSDKGRKRGRDAAKGLRALVPECDLIVASPYARAEQTAQIVADVYKGTDREMTDTLEPDRPPSAFEDWLAQHSTVKVVIAVGHEPNMGNLATWLIAGSRQSAIEFKKSGACLITFDHRIANGSGQLQWLMGPRELAAASNR